MPAALNFRLLWSGHSCPLLLIQSKSNGTPASLPAPVAKRRNVIARHVSAGERRQEARVPQGRHRRLETLGEPGKGTALTFVPGHT